MSTFYLASEEALNTGFEFEAVSKPVDSYKKIPINEKLYIVLVKDFDEYHDHYLKLSDEDQCGVWIRKIQGGYVDVSGITIKGIKENGISSEIEQHTGLTTETNIAYVIHDLARNNGRSPLAFFNHINKVD